MTPYERPHCPECGRTDRHGDSPYTEDAHCYDCAQRIVKLGCDRYCTHTNRVAKETNR